jgi:glycylpeptide N-tetradecanoyltransferase
VHKKLRSKRLAPVLIKEITRQCHLKGIFQAIYTAGVVLPTPVSTCRYFHRSLNVAKLVEARFTSVPRNSTMARMIRIFNLPSRTSIVGLREMENKDIPAVQALWQKFMAPFDMVPDVTEEDVRHYLLSGRGEGERKNWRRQGQVVWSFVVEVSVSFDIWPFA